MTIPTKLLLFSVLICFSSCISNKKHQATLNLKNKEHQAEVDLYDSQLDSLKKKVYELELNVGERIGENNILLVLRKELQTEISTLKEKIENLNNTSTSKQNNLNANLDKKEAKIDSLQAYLTEINMTIDQHENIIQEVSESLVLIAKEHSEDIEISFGFDYATIDIKETFLFKKNSATRLKDEGMNILEKFSSLFIEYPNIQVRVVGHTDTAPPMDKKRYGDNWNFSALQSATVVRALIDEYDMSANQLMLAAKAEFAPKASNATAEGKEKNRRIELYITMDSEDLAKKVRQVLFKVN